MVHTILCDMADISKVSKKNQCFNSESEFLSPLLLYSSMHYSPPGKTNHKYRTM